MACHSYSASTTGTKHEQTRGLRAEIRRLTTENAELRALNARLQADLQQAQLDLAALRQLRRCRPMTARGIPSTAWCSTCRRPRSRR